jgi:chromosome partitioning protein
MTARIVAVTNQKGGSGKTTTSMTLAAGLGLRGLKTLVVDADPQASATRWYSVAPDDSPFPATVINLAEAKSKIAQTLKDHIAAYDVIVIDCPPNLDSPVTLAVLCVADLAIAPVIPSAIDTWATEKLMRVVEIARGHNQTLQVRTLLNMVRTTALARAIIADLGDDPELDVLPIHLTLRTAYGEAAALGISVYGTTDGRAIQEANALCQTVLDHLSMTAPLPAPAPPLPAPKAEKKAPAAKKVAKKTTAKAPTTKKAAAKKVAKKAKPAARASSSKARSPSKGKA